MLRTFFLLAFFLAISTSLFAQRGMIGASINTDFTYTSSYTLYNSDPNYSYVEKRLPAFSLGGGGCLGLYFGKRFFLLTGIERSARAFVVNTKYTPNNNSNNNANSPFTDNIKQTFYSWEIPMLGNFMLTNRDNKVSFIISGGFLGGAYSLETYKEKYSSGNTVTTGLTASPEKQMDTKLYLDGSLGIGCKINLDDRVSLFFIPNYRHTLTSMQEYGQTFKLNTITVRTMLVYNF